MLICLAFVVLLLMWSLAKNKQSGMFIYSVYRDRDAHKALNIAVTDLMTDCKNEQ